MVFKRRRVVCAPWCLLARSSVCADEHGCSCPVVGMSIKRNKETTQVEENLSPVRSRPISCNFIRVHQDGDIGHFSNRKRKVSLLAYKINAIIAKGKLTMVHLINIPWFLAFTVRWNEILRINARHLLLLTESPSCYPADATQFMFKQ